MMDFYNFQRQHLTVALQILSSDDCNIVENMSDEEYREFIELVQLCITGWYIDNLYILWACLNYFFILKYIATDIGYYLQNRDRLFDSLKHFDKKNSIKRRNFLSILMTVCDLSETVKPWDEYITTVVSLIWFV